VHRKQLTANTIHQNLLMNTLVGTWRTVTITSRPASIFGYFLKAATSGLNAYLQIWNTIVPPGTRFKTKGRVTSIKFWIWFRAEICI